MLIQILVIFLFGNIVDIIENENFFKYNEVRILQAYTGYQKTIVIHRILIKCFCLFSLPFDVKLHLHQHLIDFFLYINIKCIRIIATAVLTIVLSSLMLYNEFIVY